MIFSFLFCTATEFAFAETNFTKALRTCEKYSQTGTIPYKNEIFSIDISLDKKVNKCVYKEKIYQGANWQMLTCEFDKGQLPFLANSMSSFANEYKKDIAKNKIFEAKMTTNAEIFQKYLIDPKYCAITHQKKK